MVITGALTQASPYSIPLDPLRLIGHGLSSTAMGAGRARALRRAPAEPTLLLPVTSRPVV